MSATLAAMGVAYAIGGGLVHVLGARWIWGGASVAYALASVIAYTLTRERAPQPVPKTTIDLLASSYLQRQ